MADDDRYARITLRIPKDLHTKLTVASNARSHSMNAEIIARVADSFDGPDYRLSPKLVGWITAEAKANRRDFNEELDWMLSYLRDHLTRREIDGEILQDLGEKRGLSILSTERQRDLNDLALLRQQLRTEEIMSSHMQDEAALYPKDMRLSQDLDFLEKKIRRLKNMIEDIEIKTRLPGRL